jgi:imidazolonepropionase-like amidohydrolase
VFVVFRKHTRKRERLLSNITLEFAESELKSVLEGMKDLETKMAGICETSDDEDLVADYGNDLIEVRLLLKRLNQKAIEKYGEQILDFSRNQL